MPVWYGGAPAIALDRTGVYTTQGRSGGARYGSGYAMLVLTSADRLV